MSIPTMSSYTYNINISGPPGTTEGPVDLDRAAASDYLQIRLRRMAGTSAARAGQGPSWSTVVQQALTQADRNPGRPQFVAATEQLGCIVTAQPVQRPNTYVVHELTGSAYWLKGEALISCPIGVDGQPRWADRSPVEFTESEHQAATDTILKALTELTL